jgi:Grx4 family monothiol glutaredoxin
MKGTPENPKCKFSRKILEILAQAGVKDFGTFDVLGDESIRQGLKEYANWPTFPQLYAGGKLIGGVDIVEELHKEGELGAALTPVVQEVKIAPPPVTKKQTLEERLEALINQAPIMIFMKGSPEEPRCGFSAQIVKILDENLKAKGVSYGHFDILADDVVRQGLKAYSDWPTYPQVYAKGKLVGGLDIVRELAEAGELADALNA